MVQCRAMQHYCRHLHCIGWIQYRLDLSGSLLQSWPLIIQQLTILLSLESQLPSLIAGFYQDFFSCVKFIRNSLCAAIFLSKTSMIMHKTSASIRRPYIFDGLALQLQPHRLHKIILYRGVLSRPDTTTCQPKKVSVEFFASEE